MTHIFIRTLHLRRLVQNALQHRYNLRVSSLYELNTIASDPAFAAIDESSKQALNLISYCFDSEQKRTPMFSLVEPVSLLGVPRGQACCCDGRRACRLPCCASCPFT
jgi:hypothetical protein